MTIKKTANEYLVSVAEIETFLTYEKIIIKNNKINKHFKAISRLDKNYILLPYLKKTDAISGQY